MIEELELKKSNSTVAMEMFQHVSPLYCDYNATTPLPSVLVEVSRDAHLKHWYNASSTYYSGESESKNLDKIRAKISRLLPEAKSNTVFCSSASEAINQAIYSLSVNFGLNAQIVITDSEHAAVKKAARRYFNNRVIELPVAQILKSDFSALNKIDKYENAIFFLQSANNETGIVNPISEIRNRIGDDAFLLVDASQSFGKQSDFLDLFSVVDGVIISPHKFYGPKGAGIIIWSERLGKINSLIEGGGQELGLRGGTENTPTMFVLNEWLNLAPNLISEFEKIQYFRDTFEKSVLELNKGSISLNIGYNRLMNTCSIYFPQALADEIIPALDSIGIMASSGSACHSGTPEPSASYLALGLDWDKARCVVRFSFGFSNLRLSPFELAQSITETVINNMR